MYDKLVSAQRSMHVRESVDQVQNNWYPCWTLSQSHLWLIQRLALPIFICTINRYIVHCAVNFTVWTKYKTIGIHTELCPITSFDQLHLYFTKRGIFRCIHNKQIQCSCNFESPIALYGLRPHLWAQGAKSGELPEKAVVCVWSSCGGRLSALQTASGRLCLARCSSRS